MQLNLAACMKAGMNVHLHIFLMSWERQVIWVSQTAKMDILIVGYRSDVRGAGITDGGGRDSG